jgi:DNA replication protein DnaC
LITPGVGKTHLGVALAVAACSAGYSVYFTSLDEAVRQLRVAEAAGRFAKKLQTYLYVEVRIAPHPDPIPC